MYRLPSVQRQINHWLDSIGSTVVKPFIEDTFIEEVQNFYTGVYIKKK